ncbi:MAG: ABC transporter permease [Actinomycetota bacterium]
MTTVDRPPASRPQPRSGPGALQTLVRYRSLRVIQRNCTISKQYWLVFVTRLLEPFLFLFSIGVGVGALVEEVSGPDGLPISYRSFVAPAMLVASAMNAALFATVIDFYSKFEWQGSYDSMLASPIGVRDIIHGELLWIVGYLGIQSTAFAITMWLMGLVVSWWAVLLPVAAMLVAFGFGGVGFVGASFLRSWLDFEFMSLVAFPMFLFSASFFPLSRYPGVLATVVQLTPLYQGVDLARDLTFGTVGWDSVVQVLYLFAMGAVGLAIAERRISTKLQP